MSARPGLVRKLMTVLSNLPLKQENARVIQIMTVASPEDRILRMLVDLGKRPPRKMDARRTPHGHESVPASHPTLPRTVDDLPKHEQASAGFRRVHCGDRCGGRLCNEDAGKLPS